MRTKLVTRLALTLATCAAGACVYDGGDPPPLPRLAEDPEQPELALLEHLLTGYFAGAGANAPTTCAALSPRALTPEQEEALIVRFVRLAPAARCRAEGSGVVDSFTGEPARVVRVDDFACADAVRCTARATAPGGPSTRYALRYEEGAWRFADDRGSLAE